MQYTEFDTTAENVILKRGEQIIKEIKSLQPDSQRVEGIINYLSDVHILLQKNMNMINDLLANQEKLIKFCTVTHDSVNNIHEVVETHEKGLGIVASHLEMHDTNIASINSRITFIGL